ncbi:MAG: dihydroxy-acid dehydratase [Succinivibrionaceae bacterium]|nr:dihydroxy-acid dehydratase [Succinivibrionaceae bacterium]
MIKRSADIMTGPEWANVRALYKAAGFSASELGRPVVGIVNAFNEICPGHQVLREVCERVKEGIFAGGGMAVEFGTIGACDGIAMAHDGMKYILPGREAIANDIEVMAQAHRLDALAILGSCDKIVPGEIIGALRVNLPTIFVNGGPALPGRMRKGNPYGGEHIDHSIIQQSEGALKSGKITAQEFAWLEDHAVPTIGSCAMLGTANTMCCLAEAMGLALPGSATIPAVYSERLRAAFESGEALMEMVRQGIRIRDLVTLRSIQDAVRVNSAIGGSTNAVLHMLAIAYAAGVPFTLDDFGKAARECPHLVAMIPAGPYTLLDFHEAGGVPAVMREMSSLLDLSRPTCTTRTLGENLASAENRDPSVIHPLGSPVHEWGGIAILHGNLAPAGAVTKPSAIPREAHRFTGRAVIFEGEEEALKGIRALRVHEGEVVVIRNLGPKGGPGMPEQYKAMKLLVGMGLGSKVCVITDGRFSGSNNGCFVGHICPEAYDDGPIRYLRDGDIIHVDVDNGTISAEVDFERRRQEGAPSVTSPCEGYLHHYRHSVSTASEGAIIPIRE